MSEHSQQQPRKLTKCQRCRKVIDTDLLDEHDKKWCKFKSQDKVCNSVKKAPLASKSFVQISDGRDREFFDDHAKKRSKHNSQNQLSANIDMSQPSKTCDLRSEGSSTLIAEHDGSVSYQQTFPIKSIFKCRGCDTAVQNTKLLLHLLYENIHCKQAYSKSDFFSIFELWKRTHIANKRDIKTAFQIVEKSFIFQPSSVETELCKFCGETFDQDSIDKHFTDNLECKRAQNQFPKMCCQHCSRSYSSFLIHLQCSKLCRVLTFSKEQEPFDTLPAFGNAEETSEISNTKEQEPFDTLPAFGNAEETSEISNTKPEDQSEADETCFGCGEPFKRNTILKHIGHKKTCSLKYSSEKLEELKNLCNLSKISKSRKWNLKRSGTDSSKNPIPNFTRTNRANISTPTFAKQPKVVKENLNCKSCQKSFYINGILNHLQNKKECKEKYSEQEFKHLKSKCKQYSQKLKNFNKKRHAFESKCKTKQVAVRKFQSVLRSAQAHHLKCYKETIDLEKFLHYKWQIDIKVRSSALTKYQKEKAREISQTLPQIIQSLEEMIEEGMMKIVEVISQWKYQLNKFLQGDFKYVAEKSKELTSKVRKEFDTQLEQEIASLMELLSDIGITNIDAFERSRYEWNGPSLLENHSLSTLTCDVSVPKNVYYMHEVKKLITLILEKTKSDCETILLKQFELEQQLQCESIKVIKTLTSKFSKTKILSIHKKVNESHDNLRKLSNEEQEKLLCELENICTNSEVKLGDNYIQAIAQFYAYLKNALTIKYKIHEHCNQFTTILKKSLRSFEFDVEFDRLWNLN